MAFFIQLICYWLVLWVASRFIFKKQLRSHTRKGRIAFAVSFMVIGMIHLLKPESLTYMIAGFLPYAREVVIATGIIEIGLALLLLLERWQKTVGWIIILYLAAIFPANIYVAINNLAPPGGLPAEPWYIWSRLLFQPLYILWVYYSVVRPDMVDKLQTHRITNQP